MDAAILDTAILDTAVTTVAGRPVTLGAVLAAAVALVLFLVLAGIGLAVRARRRLRADAEARARREEERVAEILKAQSEMQGRMAAMTEALGSRHAELARSLNERLDGMTQRLGTTMSEQTRATHENLSRLQERLAVIDTAQTNIQALAKDVVGLQSILSNKQTRGAFGQARMETIVADGLPIGAYAFQPTLSNGARPDCTVAMPNDTPPLVIDAKFPLEAWNAIRDAGEDAAARQSAAQRFRRDVEIHIKDIADKYLITGETQDTAFMFVPSESVFAEIHENFEGVVQRAHRARVVIVSPSLLMLSIQVIQAVLKDARMREQAHLIQGEVIRLMEDLNRLDDRVRRLQSHFTHTQKDVEQILTSTGKLTRRGEKIAALEFEPGEAARSDRPAGGKADPSQDGAVAAPAEGHGRLRLKLVDEER